MNPTELLNKTMIILFLFLSSCALPNNWGGSSCNSSFSLDNNLGQSVSSSLMSTLNSVKVVLLGDAENTGVMQNIFTSMSSQLVPIVNSLLVVYIAFLGILYMFGMIETPQIELVIRLIKIGVVLQLISPNSQSFFQNYLFDVFINANKDLIIYITGNNSGNPLIFVDQILQFLIFDPNTLIKIVALSYATMLLGPIYFIMIMIAVFQILIGAIGRTLITYCMNYIYIALLLMLAPIFIIFILFETTYSLFEAWIKNLLRSLFEPVILIAGMVFLTDIMIFVMNKIFNFGICFKCAFQPSLGSIPIPCIPGIMISNYDNMGSGITPFLFTMFGEVALFLMMASLMSKYAELASDITMAIFGSINSKAGAIGGSRNALKGAGQSLLSIVGADDKSKAKKAEQQSLKQDYDKNTKRD